MQDGALIGARFDAEIDPYTNHCVTNGLGIPRLSGNNPDTAANELQAYLVATGDGDAGEGIFSMSDLLGSGMASDEGANFVAEAVKPIERVRVRVRRGRLARARQQAGPWARFCTASRASSKWRWTVSSAPPAMLILLPPAVTSAVRTTAPRDEDILDALSSEACFVAATAEGGRGWGSANGDRQLLGRDPCRGWVGQDILGMMDLQVRFTANSVSGLVSGLAESDGLAWQHNFADVDRIVVGAAGLQPQQFSGWGVQRQLRLSGDFAEGSCLWNSWFPPAFPSSGSVHVEPSFPRTGPGGPGSPPSASPTRALRLAALPPFGSLIHRPVPRCACLFAPSPPQAGAGPDRLFRPTVRVSAFLRGEYGASQVPRRVIPWLCRRSLTPDDPLCLACSGASSAAPQP